MRARVLQVEFGIGGARVWGNVGAYGADSAEGRREFCIHEQDLSVVYFTHDQFRMKGMNVTQIIAALGNALLGALVAEAVSFLRMWWQVSRRSDLTGEWLTLSHAGDQPHVDDRVRISIRWGRLHMVNLDKPFGYSFQAWCRVRENYIVDGTWRSMRPGAFNHGKLLLLVNPQGNAMYGVYSAMDSKGKPLILGWVFGRDKETRDSAMSLLSQSAMLPH